MIAELFLDGAALFSLSQLLSYRKHEFDPQIALQRIDNAQVRCMITSMISLDPEVRLTAAGYLQDPLFPQAFASLLHPMCVEYAMTSGPHGKSSGNASDAKLTLLSGLMPRALQECESLVGGHHCPG